MDTFNTLKQRTLEITIEDYAFMKIPTGEHLLTLAYGEFDRKSSLKAGALYRKMCELVPTLGLTWCNGEHKTNGCNGYFFVPDNKIWVRPNLIRPVAASSLAHELGHVLRERELNRVGKTIRNSIQAYEEIIAQTIACLVLAEYDIDILNFSAFYVTSELWTISNMTFGIYDERWVWNHLTPFIGELTEELLSKIRNLQY